MTSAAAIAERVKSVLHSVLLESESSYISIIFSNIANTIKAIGSYAILILGIVLVIVAVVHIVQGFASKGQTAWFMTFGTLLFGGFLMFGGWTIITGFVGGTGKNTLDAVMGDMTPTVADPIKATTGAISGVDTAKNALFILVNSFFTPFAQALAVSVGVIMIIMAAVQIAKYFMAKGRGQISLIKVGVIALMGSVLFTATPTDNSAGWTWIVNTAVGATRDTIVNAAEGSSTNQTHGYTSPNFNIGNFEATEEVTKES